MIDPQYVIIKINEAFAGVALGTGTSLNECEYNDSGGSCARFLELAKEDEREDWRRVVNDRLTEFTVTFSFTDLNGYRFYLPAYMTWTVANHKTSDSIISDFTVYACDPHAHQFNQPNTGSSFVDWFTFDKLSAIILFLQYCSQNDDFPDGRVARRNLERFRKHAPMLFAAP